jgi:hypothetical protein
MNTYLNKYNKYKLKYLYLKGGGNIVSEDTSVDIDIPESKLRALSNNNEIHKEITNLIKKLQKSEVPNHIMPHSGIDERYTKKITKIQNYYKKINNSTNNVVLAKILLRLLTRLVNICNDPTIYSDVEQIDCSTTAQQAQLIRDDINFMKYLIDLITIYENIYDGELYEETYNAYQGLLKLTTLI